MAAEADCLYHDLNIQIDSFRPKQQALQIRSANQLVQQSFPRMLYIIQNLAKQSNQSISSLLLAVAAEMGFWVVGSEF